MSMDLLLAYFDPSTGSLLLQALVGGFGGVVVLGRYLWMQFTVGRFSPTVPVAVSKTPSPVQSLQA